MKTSRDRASIANQPTMISFQSHASKTIRSCSKYSEDGRSLLYTYRKFITPSALLEIWNGILEEVSATEGNPELVNISEFMYLWMSEFWTQDFNQTEQETIQKTIVKLPNAKSFKFLLLKLASDRNRACKIYHSEEQRVAINRERTIRSKSFAFGYGRDEGDVGRNLQQAKGNLSSRNLLVPSPSSGCVPQTTNSDPTMSRSRSSSRANVDELFGKRERSATISDVTALNNFSKWTPVELANAITFQFSNKFLALSPLDFLKKIGWGTKKEDTPAFSAMVNCFNKTSRWVITEVMHQTDKESQVGVITKMIAIAKRLENMQNYDATLAVLCGLSHYSVQNLKEAWAALPERAKEEYSAIEKLLSPINNFRGYTAKVATGINGAAVPYVGIILRDLTFLMENKAVNSEGQINLELIRGIANRLFIIRSCQTEVYTLVVPEILMSFLDSVVVMSDDEKLHKLFCERNTVRKKFWSFNTLRKMVGSSSSSTTL
eukprot:TRINITY_DN2658_c0_g1_i8.p1 TRINITY_DN2658_c0_g1~~TRINITY_DN2658_c0_g1_i8.p1  ORF type:complete len:490 (-),score=106.75 TRINITY_DN2658_c0_g1_i8:51-1520(-)